MEACPPCKVILVATTRVDVIKLGKFMAAAQWCTGKKRLLIKLENFYKMNMESVYLLIKGG
jgi:hypothetical protein